MKQIRQLGLLLVLSAAVAACRKEPSPVPAGGFPEEIAEILVTNCATSGCHDDASYAAEGRMSLSGWEQMFQGSRAGAAVIPYRPELSFMLYFMNTDTGLGIAQQPTMPLSRPALTREQYLKVRDWIAAGAPHADGRIKWADNPGRSKIYVTNQGCDKVAVLDLEKRLVMRYVDVGSIPGLVEAPHNVRVSPDGQYWYVVFVLANPYVEKYDANTDELVGRADIGAGSWNTLDFSPDGQHLVTADLSSGTAVVIETATMTEAARFSIGGSTHGVRFAPGGGAVYFTQQEGDELTKLSYQDLLNPDGIETLDLEQHIPRTHPARAMGPHEILFTPGGDRYAVTCSYQDEVRIYQASNDSLLAVLHVGNYPVEIVAGSNPNRFYITCMEDTTLFPSDNLRRGSVAVIDWEAMTLVASAYPGFQPHGICLDAPSGLLYVSNRNVSVNGPAPHHSSACGGRNGTITALDISTLTLLPGFKHELSADPYSISIRR